MTTKEKIEEIEGKIAVDQIKVEKFGRTFQIYPWLKGRLFHKHITGSETLQKKTFGLVIKQFLSLFYGCWNLIGKYDTWAFTNSAERRLIDGKYYDKLFDFVGNESGKKVLLIELRLFQYYAYRKVASKKVISKSLFIFLEEFYGRFILRMPNVQNQEVLDELNTEFSEGVSEREVIRKYLSQYKMMRFWLQILPNPKVVFISVSYTNFGYIRAFKEKGIKVVEGQHGLITKNHSAYFYKKEFDSIQFPDELLTVGDSEVDVFNAENSLSFEKITPVGSFILDYYGSKDTKLNFSTPPKMLIAFQDGVIGDQLAAFIVDLLPKLENLVEITIQTRRTSPSYYKENYPELKSLNFSNDEFYQALLNCDLHATVYSTTAIEALTLGRQNVLINIDNLSVEQLSSKLGTNAYTTIVNDVDSFVQAVSQIKEVDRNLIKESNSNNIKPGYRENVMNFIESSE